MKLTMETTRKFIADVPLFFNGCATQNQSIFNAEVNHTATQIRTDLNHVQARLWVGGERGKWMWHMPPHHYFRIIIDIVFEKNNCLEIY